MYSYNIREEELKNIVAQDFFEDFDCTKIIRNIDFCVSIKYKKNETSLFELQSFFWAEAKKGNSDIYKSIVQLIITIGKARTFDNFLAPQFIGAFDCKKIAFISYSNIQDIFYLNDFNWNVAPSNHNTKEFKLIYNKIVTNIEKNSLIFSFKNDKKILKSFLKQNFLFGKTNHKKIKIDKNNFLSIYNKWIISVKPSIAVNWNNAKKFNIIDGDFYLADLLSHNNCTLNDKLYVVLKDNHYELDRKIDHLGMLNFKETVFNDNQIAHNQFWNKFDRPPKEEYWDYIIERRDLLVPQDIRQRKGSFFTPPEWVELSQQYLSEQFGENWQDEYYIWDCAAGTGNLLDGLTNKYNIWASTVDQQDIEVISERIDNGANLLPKHVFLFDFLNDDLDKIPDSLKSILANKEKRKKLIIYINPPYVEGDNRKGQGRKETANTEIHKKYAIKMGYAKRELYIQFLTRIYEEISDCYIANFSTLKNLQGPRFKVFRQFFEPKIERIFVVPADTFDNVKGKFPIGFQIWNTKKTETFNSIKADIYNKNKEFLGIKKIWSYDNEKLINDWVKTFRRSTLKESQSLATIIGVASDFQNQRLVRLGPPFMKVPASNHNWQITVENIIESAIYFTVRKIIPATWINNKEQFLFPQNSWKDDITFHSDCLTYFIFTHNFSLKFGINNWIPFSENEINAQEKFQSNFIYNFINGRLESKTNENLFDLQSINKGPFTFSQEAKDVFSAGKELWIYYHKNKNCNVNASFYDIREFFQGRDKNGKMRHTSDNEKYIKYINQLRKNIKILSENIEPKIYEHRFLRTAKEL